MENDIYISDYLGTFTFERGPSDYETPKRDFSVLSYRISGGTIFSANGLKNTANSGDIIYIPTALEYKQKNEDEEKIIAIHFKSNAVNDNNFFVYKNCKQMEKYFVLLAEIYQKKDPNYLPYSLSLIYKILKKLIDLKKMKDKSNIPSYIKRAIDLIHNEYTNSDSTVSYVCEKIGVSQSYLRQGFKKYLNTSPHNYIRNLRMELADDLLNTEYYHIYEVAHMCGYDNEKNFITAYRKFNGFSPGKYKNNC